MLIKIDNSVVDYILHNKASEFDQEIIALNNLAIAHREGKHIITGSLKVLEFLKDLELLDLSARRAYTYLYSKFTFLTSYEKIFNEYIVVKSREYPFARLPNEMNQIFEVPITHFVNIDCSDRTHLVTEELNDFDFYYKLATKYISEKKYNIRLSFNPINGGGNNTFKNFERYILNNYIVLAIADSDKDYPTANIGQTLGNIITVFNSYKDSKIVGLHKLDVREKENLIPPSLYLKCANSSIKNVLRKLQKIESIPHLQDKLLYLDLKDGLKVGNLKNNQVSWKYYYDLIKEVNESIACTIEQIPGLNENEKLIDGIGDQFFKKFQYYFFDDGLENRLEKINGNDRVPTEVILDLEESLKVKNKFFDHIPSYLKQHIEKLCNKIISWGCSNDINPT